MDISNSLRGGIIIVATIALAIWLGVSIATDQLETAIKFGAAIMFLFCLFLGRKIWLLLIFSTALNMQLIRGFGSPEIGQMAFVGFTMLIILMRRQPLNFRFQELEFWMLVVVACLVQVYLRNPVGLNMFGAGDVGARPYFMVTLALVTSILLSSIVVPHKEIKFAFLLNMLGLLLSPLTGYLTPGGPQSRGMSSSANSTLGDNANYERSGFRGIYGNSLTRIITAYVSPLRAILHPLWAPLILISLAFAASSGYRNNIAAVGLMYLVAIAYRGGFGSVILSCTAGVFGIALLALLNLAVPLPLNVQRALSPFPGTWDKRIKADAQESTDWRVEMWKEALFTDYWIRNKYLGDGLGLKREELKKLEASNDGSGGGLASMGSGMTAQQEAMMITGGYHSGPVQCVRIIGYVGLMFVIILMIRVAVHSHQQILRCRGTEWYPVALFFGIPNITLPIMYVFIFGDFGRDVSATFIAYGMIRLLEKNLPLPPYVKPTRTPYILKSHRALRN